MTELKSFVKLDIALHGRRLEVVRVALQVLDVYYSLVRRIIPAEYSLIARLRE
jgi:hypothetical protein